MINVDINNLNTLEKKIYNNLMEASKSEEGISIKRAAEICDCSTSKISKFVCKLGFANYKQYIRSLYGEELEDNNTSDQLGRVENFLKEYDKQLVERLIDELFAYDRVILFGYGPSLICAQYFEYKLRIVSDINVMTAVDEFSAINQMHSKSLLIVFSATGAFASFENLYKVAKEKGCGFILIVEEYNTALISSCENIYFLTKSFQSADLKPYEKSRSIFFIFIEEVIFQIISSKTENL